MTGRSTRMRRIKEGCCSTCGATLPPDSAYLSCDKCRAIARAKYHKRKGKGVCVDCGNPVGDNGTSRCDKCRKANREQMRKDREFAKAMGLCTTCRNEPAAKGYTKCARCLEKERNRKYVRTEEQKKRSLEHNRMKRREARESGICITCLKRRVRPGMTICSLCSNKAKQRRKDYRLHHTNKLSMYEARDLGICTLCRRRPVMQGKKLCEKCYNTTLLNLAKAKEAQNSKEHYWMQDNKLTFLAKTARGSYISP